MQQQVLEHYLGKMANEIGEYNLPGIGQTILMESTNQSERNVFGNFYAFDGTFEVIAKSNSKNGLEKGISKYVVEKQTEYQNKINELEKLKSIKGLESLEKISNEYTTLQIKSEENK